MRNTMTKEEFAELLKIAKDQSVEIEGTNIVRGLLPKPEVESSRSKT